jgi:hypothetical protein
MGYRWDKLEIRIPKSERNPKLEIRRAHSDLGFLSDFGPRFSDFAAAQFLRTIFQVAQPLRTFICLILWKFYNSSLAHSLHWASQPGEMLASVRPVMTKHINNRNIRMKLNRIITMCAVAAAMLLSVGSAFAQQDNGGNNNNQDNQRRNRQGGGGGFGGGGNFDPAQMQQRIMDNVRDQLNFTNDTDWAAVQPLVQKVLDARRDVGGQGMRGLFQRRSRDGGNQGGNQQRGGGMFGTPSPEQEALQNALDQDAPAAQVKDLLAKYKASQQAKQTKLENAEDALKAVLSTKQEATAYILGLVR